MRGKWRQQRRCPCRSDWRSGAAEGATRGRLNGGETGSAGAGLIAGCSGGWEGDRRAAACRAAPRGAIDRVRAEVGGEEDAEDGTVAAGIDGGAQLHFAAVTLDDGAGDPESEAGAALALGGEEWLSEAALDLERDAAAIVANGDTDAANAGIGPAVGAAYAEAETAMRGGSFESIGDKIGEDLAHFAGIEGGFFLAVVLPLDDDALFADGAVVEEQHFLEQVGEANRNGAGGFTGKAKGLAADLGDAFELALGEREVVGNGGGKVLFQAEQVEEVHDRLERIVDFVGDGGSETADGDKLLIFAQHDGGAIEIAEGLRLENSGLANFERAIDGGGEALHFAGLEEFGGTFAENAGGFGFGDVAAGNENGNRGIGGTSAIENFTGADVREPLRTGDDEVG